MARKNKGGPAGAPAWMVTFADLMSLLVCFFVLIISFSIQDDEKMQIVAGSMRIAFGIQDEFKAKGVVEVDGRPNLRTLMLQPTDNPVVLMPIPDVSPPEDIETDEADEAKPFSDVSDPALENDEPQTADASDFSTVSDMRADADIPNDVSPPETDTPMQYPSDQIAEIQGDTGTDASEEQPPPPLEWEKEYKEAVTQALEKRLTENLQAEIAGMIEANPDLKDMAKHVQVEQVEEGVRLQLVDQQDRSMFPSGSAQVTPRTERLLAAVAQMLVGLPNRIAISGHTDASPFRGRVDYDNWNLSSDRAHATRRSLTRFGVSQSRIASVVGKAATEPYRGVGPYDPRNRRIGITLLRSTSLRKAELLPPGP